MNKKRLALVAAAVVIAVVAGAYFVEFSVPGLAERIFEQAERDAGITLSARDVRFAPARWIRLEGVEATTSIPSGTLTASVERVVLEHRLLPLLRGAIVVDRLVLENPVVTLSSATGGLTGAAAPRRDSLPGAADENGGRRAFGASAGAASRPLRVALAAGAPPRPSRRANGPAPQASSRDITVHAAVIRDGVLILRSAAGTSPTTTVSDIDVELQELRVDAGTPVAVGLTGHGHIDVGKVESGRLQATGNRARLEANNGVFTVEGLALTTAEGAATLDRLAVDLRPDPYTYHATVTSSDLDLNPLLGMAGANGLGTAQVELELSGAGSARRDLAGQGRIRLAAGRIPDAPLLALVAPYLRVPLAGAAYQATDVDFVVHDDRVRIAPFDLVSEAIRLRGEGDIRLDGLMAMRARVAVPRENVRTSASGGNLPDGVLDILTDESGWVTVPLLIGGTIDAPSAAPDTEALLAALQQSAGSGLSDWLRALIKR